MRNRSLSFKLTVFILFSVGLIFLAAFAYNYYFSREAVLGYVKENAGNLTQATVSRMESVLSGVQKAPRQLALWLELNPYREDDLLKNIRALLLGSPEIFGSTIAFEPGAFQRRKFFYAPYSYREKDQTIKTIFLGDGEYQYFFRDWYQVPRELNQAVWSEPYYDEGGGNIVMATYSVPFNRMEKGAKVFGGVVTADLSLAWLQEIVGAVKIYKTGYAFLISQNGVFVTHPRKDLILRESLFSLAEERGDKNLREIGRAMIRGEQGFVPTREMVSGKKSWLAYAPLAASGWSLGVVIPEEELLAGIQQLNREVLLIGLLGGILLVIAISLVSGTITKPLRFLALKTKEIAQGNLDSDLPESGSRDEIGQLTRSFGEMRLALKMYIRHLAEVTAVKERIESELKIASTIQQSFLSRHFPSPGADSPFDLHALLEPAKEVGGDFYDFSLLDDDHLYLAVGDVSDKGVPAALLMAVTKTLLKSLAGPGIDPADILKRVNQEITRENAANMFVTVFLGILNTSNGRLVYSNAGHLPPVRIRSGREPEWLPLPKGFVLGGLENARYRPETVILEPGDRLVLYTDGVTEAMNGEGALYAGSRLLAAVRESASGSAAELVGAVKDSVQSFVQDNPQADDITLMGVLYRGKRKGSEIINN
ncbi:MAG: SpoIIE family protein phosphatase [Deltaproteobacteria bacterium]|nr:SpoIIE family protein phosphatase [Deltaproteobacteria bacterium]